MKKTKRQFLTVDVVQTALGFNERRKIAGSFNALKAVKRIHIEKMIEDLFDRAYSCMGDLYMDAYVTEEPLPFERRTDGRKIRNLKIGDKWAKNNFDCAWFHITGRVPAVTAGKKVVCLLNLGGEGLVCKNDGTPVQSITCYASDYDYMLGFPMKRVVSDFSENGKVDFWVDAAANDLFGHLKDGAAIDDACIAVCNENIRALAYDLQVLISVYDTNKDDEYTGEIFNVCKKLLNTYKTISDSDTVNIRKSLAPLLAQKNSTEQFEYYAVGHAHLDLAWKWPIRESKRKGARTFSTQLHNIEHYPDYIFGASQAQLYSWIKTDYPALYERVRAAAKTPNWDVQGATWVEMDSNLVSGESLIRQFYYGKKFFREEFGQDMKILWLPDSFGYSACIPQVMKLAEVPYFLTQKMSWNTVNKFPYHMFKWQAIDGAEVFAHMLPESTYNSPVSGERTKYGERNYQERAISDKSIMLFGIGDGGAGPGYEHLERLQRFKDLSHMPKVTPKKSLDSFKLLDDGVTKYPLHKGELYLERHQGTYTTQCKSKKYNRKCEFSLKNYEYLMLLAKKKDVNAPISPGKLEEMWKEVLLYQFHDILPGSSISRVYEESTPRYEAILEQLKAASKTLSCKLFGHGLLNLNSFQYSGVFNLDGEWYTASLPPMGFLPVSEMTKADSFTVKATNTVIENDKLRVTFSDGCITSLFDKSIDHEFVRPSTKMGVFSSYIDVGDCWDIRPHNYQKSKKDAVCTSFCTLTDGARAVAEAQFRLNDSTIQNRFILTQGSNILEMELDIDCHQKMKMMRIGFPVNVQTDVCKFNIQFGHLSRKTTESNSVEKAQFEVSGQKFVDMSNRDCGFTLINDCKYGYRCKNGIIDLNLIRSPIGGPGKNVDQGRHSVKLAIYTHSGALDTESYRHAYIVNNEIETVYGDGENNLVAPYHCDNENIVLEAVKLAEEKDSAILHLYNCNESGQKCTIAFDGYKVTSITNVMEDEDTMTLGTLEFHAFELKLVRIKKVNQ